MSNHYLDANLSQIIKGYFRPFFVYLRMAMAEKNNYILIAEDDEDDQFLLTLAFKEAVGDAKLVFVKNGIELVKYFRDIDSGENKNLPSLLIVDLNMPKKNGREAIKELVENNTTNGFPTVIFSTTVNEFERGRCEELGITNFFVKPSDYNQLVTLAGRFAQLAGKLN